MVKLKVYSATRAWRSSADVRKPHCILSAFWHLKTNSIHSPLRVQIQEKRMIFWVGVILVDNLTVRSHAGAMGSWLRARLNVQPQYCFIAQLCSQTICNQCLVADEIDIGDIEPEWWRNPCFCKLKKSAGTGHALKGISFRSTERWVWAHGRFKNAVIYAILGPLWSPPIFKSEITCTFSRMRSQKLLQLRWLTPFSVSNMKWHQQ